MKKKKINIFPDNECLTASRSSCIRGSLLGARQMVAKPILFVPSTSVSSYLIKRVRIYTPSSTTTTRKQDLGLFEIAIGVCIVKRIRLKVVFYIGFSFYPFAATVAPVLPKTISKSFPAAIVRYYFRICNFFL